MVNENYTNPNEIGNRVSDYFEGNLEATATEPRTKKKSKLLRNLVIGGVLAGSLIVANAKYDLVDEMEYFIVQEILPNPIPTELKDETGKTILKF
jgi:hypothetical protein